jgi:DNA invertase Pin-like site-specific DNA recombinase
MKLKRQLVVSCAIYTGRCPDDREAGQNSHQVQCDACMAYVACQREHGWRALRTRYIDSNSSRPIMQRSSLSRLLDHVRKGMIHVVVVYRLEQLSVNLAELAEIVEVLQQHNAELVSVSQQLNTCEPAGRLAVKLLLSFASFERKSTSESQARVSPLVARKPPLTGSTTPDYEKLLERKKDTDSGSRHTIRIEFLVMGAERKKAFLSWARRGFRFRKPAVSQSPEANSAKTA